MVTTTNIHDSKAVKLLIRTLSYFLIPIILADGGYRGEIAEKIKLKYNYFIKVINRKEDVKHNFKPISKRWIIERVSAWFDNDRRLCGNYELLFENSENMIKLTVIKNLLNKI